MWKISNLPHAEIHRKPQTRFTNSDRKKKFIAVNSTTTRPQSEYTSSNHGLRECVRQFCLCEDTLDWGVDISFIVRGHVATPQCIKWMILFTKVIIKYMETTVNIVKWDYSRTGNNIIYAVSCLTIWIHLRTKRTVPKSNKSVHVSSAASRFICWWLCLLRWGLKKRHWRRGYLDILNKKHWVFQGVFQARANHEITCSDGVILVWWTLYWGEYGWSTMWHYTSSSHCLLTAICVFSKVGI